MRRSSTEMSKSRRYAKVLTLASRSILWDEFRQACIIMKVPFIDALREAIYLWVKSQKKEVELAWAKHGVRWRKVKPDLMTLFTVVCLGLHRSQKTCVELAMRDWLDMYRRGDVE